MNENTSCCGRNCHDPASLAQPQTIVGESIGPQTPLQTSGYVFTEMPTGPMEIIHPWTPGYDWAFDTEFNFVPPRLKLKIKKLHPDAILPTRAYQQAVGYDIYALEDVYVWDGDQALVKTGIAIIPPRGWYAEIKEKSGLAAKGLGVGGGQIDPDYRGDITVIVRNFAYKQMLHVGLDSTPPKLRKSPFRVEKGSKIAQLVFKQYGDFDIEEVTEFEETERSNKGFGSSGT